MNVSGSKVLLRSLLASYLLSGVLLLILSFALYRLKLGEEQVNAAVYGVYVIACLFGGFLDFLGALFPYLPEEIMLLLTFGIAAVVFIGILKAVRR